MSNRGAAPGKMSGLRRYTSVLILALNAILLTGIFVMCILYANAYKERLHTENLSNIANLNRSAAIKAMSMFENWTTKLDDIARYAELHDLSYEETLKTISDSNSSDKRYFELIGADYKGNLARQNDDGTFLALDYSSSSYSALQGIFKAAAGGYREGVNFAPEYTDGGKSAVKHFALYRHLSLRDANGVKQPYTLMLAEEASEVLYMLNEQSDFEGQSTVMMDASGDYIVSNKDYKSSNFFQYMYVYNDLSLDEVNDIRKLVKTKGSGELYYKNADTVVEDCVFRFEIMSPGDWYCVTCVPLSSFHSPALNINYVIYIVALLLILFGMDILWLRRMNRRLRVSMMREKEASAAKGSFMSRMSHEIRTPLNAVIGYNSIAQNELADTRTEAERKQAEMKVMDCLVKSDIASKHLLSIINDVLDMSVIESGKVNIAHDRFDFKGLITSLTTVFYSQAKSKGIRFEVIFDTLTEEWFVGDQMRTNQILTNLLSNAVKFTPEGGSVTLKIQQTGLDVKTASINFEVTDTGIGMSDEYLKRIWAPFEQADSSISRRFGGTGLGLSITKSLVDLMGGEIVVTSEPGKGTTFNVDLKFERTRQPYSREVYDFTGIKALVVDDDESTCDYIRVLFTRCGVKCETVNSGKDALRAVKDAVKTGEPYTVCLVDWLMPQMDGIETIRRIRDYIGQDLPIIVLTAYDYTELADKATAIGVNRFISKPLFQSSLFDLLANINGIKTTKPIKKAASVDFAGARVLLAEDNEMNMEIAQKILKSSGLQVDSAWNGKEAVEKFKESEAGTYMAILMDVHMPELNGYEATKLIRSSQHPDATTVPIIAMTADAFAENVAEALASGMNDHISKPIDIPNLFATLRKYM